MSNSPKTLLFLFLTYFYSGSLSAQAISGQIQKPTAVFLFGRTEDPRCWPSSPAPKLQELSFGQVKPYTGQLYDAWVNGRDIYVAGEKGQIFYSNNGKSWVQQKTPVEEDVIALFGESAKDLYALSDAGALLHSVGEGAWSKEPSPSSTKLVAGAARKSSEAPEFFVLDEDGRVFQKRGREPWIKRKDKEERASFRKLWASPEGVYLVGQRGPLSRGGVLLSSQDGVSWSEEKTRGKLFDVFSQGDDVYAVGSKGLLLHSSDAGKTWKKQRLPGRVELYSVFGTPQGEIFVAGEGGALFYSKGDDQWVEQKSDSQEDLISIIGSQEGDLLLVGVQGSLLHKSLTTEELLQRGRALGNRGGYLYAVEDLEAVFAKAPETPGLLFSLGCASFGKEANDYLEALQKFDEALLQFDEGKLTALPPEPTPRYTKTIAFVEALLAKGKPKESFDGALYLLGYCLSEQGETERALEQFTRLVKEAPESRFAQEVYLRIAELKRTQNQLDEAIFAYESAVKDKTGAHYEPALYLLAWSYYRRGMGDPTRAKEDLLRAVEGFKTLLVRDTAQEIFYQEAVMYLAILLTEDWDGDGVEDWKKDPAERPVERVKRFLTNPAQSPYAYEVMMKAADILSEQQLHSEAEALKAYAVVYSPKKVDH